MTPPNRTLLDRTTLQTGLRGEELVCDKLRSWGFRIIERNVRERFAELDIIAEDGDILCFVEVRTRRTARHGHPAETITPTKQRKIRRAAEAYILCNRVHPRPMRFDVATIVWDTGEFEYFRDAFQG